MATLNHLPITTYTIYLNILLHKNVSNAIWVFSLSSAQKLLHFSYKK